MLKKLLQNDYGLSAIKKISSLLSGIISISLINRYLGPELKGQYASIMNIIDIAFVVLAWGYVNMYPYEKKNRDEVVLNKFMGTMIIEFLFLSMVGVLVCFVDIKMLIYVMVLPVYVFSFQLNQVFMIENMRNNTIANIAMNLCNLFGSIILMFLPRHLSYAFLLFVIKELSFVIFTIFINIKCLKNIIIKDSLKYSKHLLKIGFLPMLTTLLISINYRLDILFLNYFDISYYKIGLYSLGLSLAQYVWIIPDIFKDVLTKKSATKDFVNSTTLSVKICSNIIVMIIGFMVIAGKIVIKLLFGNEYIESFPVVLILLLGSYSMIFTKLIGTIYYSEGLTKRYFAILLVCVCINVVLNIMLIPKFDIYGAAVATVASYTLSGFAFLIDYSKEYSQNIFNLLFIKRKDILKIKEQIMEIKDEKE